MTASLAGSTSTAPVQRGPRLDKPAGRQPDLTQLAQQFAQLRRIHGRPQCAQQRALFELAERAVEEVARLGLDPATAEVTIDGQKIAANEPIETVQTWCQTCPFKDICLQLMTTAPPSYTGIAGGQILHKSQPYRSRTETQPKRGSGGAGE